MKVFYGAILFFSAIAIIAMGGFVFPIALGFVSYLAGNEFIGMVQAKGIRPSVRIIRNMIIAFFVIAALPVVPGLNLSWNWSLEHFPILLTVGMCAAFFRLLLRHEDPPARIADIATTILGCIYTGFLPCHLVLLRNLCPPGTERIDNPLQQPGLAYVWVTFFIIWATDIFAWFVGKRFGKHLLYPQVSPKKTVEGAVGGFLASVFWATVVVYVCDNYLFPSRPFHNKLWQAPLMGAVVSIASQLGDLCESLLKRDAGFKDSSQLIPGHGGFLDRGDSLIFAGPISYYWICAVILGLL
jgi:phosphatidate cytidylyltransferase